MTRWRWWWRRYFQFLWGWNSECHQEEVGRKANFQFLWGWNLKNGMYEIHAKDKYNLSIPLRMKPRPRVTWEGRAIKDKYNLSIPLRMKQRKEIFCGCETTTFNSFEDETIWYNHFHYFSFGFQFLWGWNPVLQLQKDRDGRLPFNSFEDET